MKTGIIGIGCIGSSLARDIKGLNLGDVYICDANPAHLEGARQLGLGDAYFEKAAEMAEACDLVFICTPVTTIPAIIRQIAGSMKPGSIISDVGSVKSFILEQISGDIPDGVHYIPGHPITSGTVETGPTAGRKGVFDDTTYILTPAHNENEQAVQTLSDLLKKIGARLVLLTPEKHDQLLGFTSHLSHIIAFSMMNSAGKLADTLGEDVFRYAGGSFRDLTRVAASDVKMWRDIFLCNHKHIRELYKLLLAEMDDLNTLIENEDIEGLDSFLGNAAECRRTCFD